MAWIERDFSRKRIDDPGTEGVSTVYERVIWVRFVRYFAGESHHIVVHDGSLALRLPCRMDEWW